MLMVVFGAGASYDSAAALRPDRFRSTWRPPLANQLFDLRRFGLYIEQFPRCQPIITHLQEAEVNVEQVLEKYQTEATKDPERIRQLAAVRYYLQTMLSHCTTAWTNETKGVTNYKTLLDEIRHYRTPGDKVCLVTFNYDTLLEAALPSLGVSINTISDYIGNDYHIIKLHGSVNWAHEVSDFHSVTGQNSLATAYELIEKSPELKLGDRFLMANGAPIQSPGPIPYFPALAIPVENKQGYECPAEQLQALRECLPQVTKLLIIGWRGAEDPFLKLLANNMGKATTIIVVSSGEAKAGEVITRIRNAGVVAAQFLASKGGFSQAIVTGEVEGFLKS